MPTRTIADLEALFRDRPIPLIDLGEIGQRPAPADLCDDFQQAIWRYLIRYLPTIGWPQRKRDYLPRVQAINVLVRLTPEIQGMFSKRLEPDDWAFRLWVNPALRADVPELWRATCDWQSPHARGTLALARAPRSPGLARLDVDRPPSPEAPQGRLAASWWAEGEYWDDLAYVLNLVQPSAEERILAQMGNDLLRQLPDSPLCGEPPFQLLPTREVDAHRRPPPSPSLNLPPAHRAVPSSFLTDGPHPAVLPDPDDDDTRRTRLAAHVAQAAQASLAGGQSDARPTPPFGAGVDSPPDSGSAGGSGPGPSLGHPVLTPGAEQLLVNVSAVSLDPHRIQARLDALTANVERVLGHFLAERDRAHDVVQRLTGEIWDLYCEVDPRAGVRRENLQHHIPSLEDERQAAQRWAADTLAARQTQATTPLAATAHHLSADRQAEVLARVEVILTREIHDAQLQSATWAAAAQALCPLTGTGPEPGQMCHRCGVPHDPPEAAHARTDQTAPSAAVSPGASAPH